MFRYVYAAYIGYFHAISPWWFVNCCRSWFFFFHQVICDASNMITNVEAKWPGSVHDARMYRESNLNAKFQQGALHFMKCRPHNCCACARYLKVCIWSQGNSMGISWRPRISMPPDAPPRTLPHLDHRGHLTWHTAEPALKWNKHSGYWSPDFNVYVD